MDMRMKVEKKQKCQRKRKIKVWELNGDKKIIFRNKVQRDLNEDVRRVMSTGTVGETWHEIKRILISNEVEVCGTTSGRSRSEKDVWWWGKKSKLQ